MTNATPRMDVLVKDYLLYRGLTGCMRVLENELKVEKDKSLRVDKIIEQINAYLSNQDLGALWEYWNFLNVRFFSRLEQRFMPTVQKLEQGLLKLYVVAAYQAQRPDKVKEFFEVMAPELYGQEAFKDWFAFPFLKNVEEQTAFAMYFSKQWQDTFSLSLSNFLSIVIQSMHMPTLLSFEAEQRKIKSLQEENTALKQQLKALNAEGPPSQTDSNSKQTSSTLELFDDFYVISGEHADKEKTIQPSAKVERKKISLFSPTNLLGLKGQTTAATLGSARRISHGNAPPNQLNNSKLPKSKPVENVMAKLGLFQNASSQNKVPRNNAADTSHQKSASHVIEGQGHKVDDRLSVTSSPVLCKRTSPAKIVPKMTTSGFTSYITKPSHSDTMVISRADTESPFLLLSQESYGEHSSAVTSVRFSYSSQYITSVDRDGIVKIWTWSPQPVTKATVMLKPAFLSAEWANKTDRHVLLGTKTGNIRLYDVRENKSVCEVPTDAGYPNVVALCPNPSGTQFVCSGMAERARITTLEPNSTRLGRLSVWELKSMKVLSNLATSPTPVATNCMTFNHNGQLLLTGGADGHIRLYDINQTMCINEWSAHSGEVTAIQFSSDENSCFSMGTDDKFLQWSMNKCGQQLADIQLHGGACNPETMTQNCGYHSNMPHGKLFVFEAEGNYILTCGRNGGIIYELSDMVANNVMELGRHWSPVSTIDWSPAVDNRVCLTGSFDGRVQVSTFLSK